VPVGAAASDGEEELDADTALDLVNLGIVSPVTRQTAGSLYHQELSRQVRWGVAFCGWCCILQVLLPMDAEPAACSCTLALKICLPCFPHALPPTCPPDASLPPLQLADFLHGPMERASGMMPLPDVYCLYNRARGVELISPDDLLHAIRLFPQVQLRLFTGAGREGG
jgi:hypothetical protein